MPIRCDSNTLFFTPTSSTTAMNSGTTNPASLPDIDVQGRQPPAATDCVAQVAAVSARIAQAPDEAAVLTLLGKGMRCVGADSAVLISFVRDDCEFSACRFLLACDPVWCQQYLASGLPANDPWLNYATHHSEPALASQLMLETAEQAHIVELAEHFGFRSTVLAPAHSAVGHSRVSLLCLGSSSKGHFEGDEFLRVRIGARIMALELHDWWIAKLRRELVMRARLSADDLLLLRAERHGHSSKRIAAELNASIQSINSRFQRLNAKLGVANRRLAAKLAAECGLISD